jgi:hypothetical protein
MAFAWARHLSINLQVTANACAGTPRRRQLSCLRDDPDTGFLPAGTGDHAADVVLIDFERRLLCGGRSGTATAIAAMLIAATVENRTCRKLILPSLQCMGLSCPLSRE